MDIQQLNKQLDKVQQELDKARKMLTDMTGEGKPAPQKVAETGQNPKFKPQTQTHKKSEVTNNQNQETQESKKNFRILDGVHGVFDGKYMVTPDGEKHEVSANYAAKSKLVFGDKLKMIEENGKTLFKHIEKVSRQKVDGILSKRDDKWFFVSDSGAYRISPVAADFQKAEIGDEAVALLPENIVNVTFATLDRVIKPKTPSKPLSEAPKAEKSNAAPPTQDTENTREQVGKQDTKQIKPEKGQTTERLPTEFDPRLILDEDLK